MIKKIRKSAPEITTASLPDIIFMLLFFFMVVTVLKRDTSNMLLDVPKVEHQIKLKHDDNRAYVYIGLSDPSSKEIKIQINDKFTQEKDLESVFLTFGSELGTDKSSFEVSLKADKNTPMKIIDHVTLSMRKAGLKKLNYLVEGLNNS